jgi:ATP-binding cassette subfamily F protein uup
MLREEKEQARIATAAPAQPKSVVVPTAPSAPKVRMGFKEKREFEQLEKEIPELEAKKSELEQALTAVADNHEELLRISSEFEQVKNLLEEKELRWLELSEMEA